MSADDATYLQQLQAFGAEFWPGVEYTCAIEDYLGACIAYDEADRTHIFFDINFWNRKATTILIGQRNEDWVEGCTYPDFSHWNEVWNWRYAKECEDRRVSKGQAVAGLNTMLAEKWPTLVGNRSVPPTPTPRPSPTPFPTFEPIVAPTPTPYVPEGLNIDADHLIEGLSQSYVFEKSTGLDLGNSYDIGRSEGKTITIARDGDKVMWVSFMWHPDAPYVEGDLSLLGVHIDPFSQTWCVNLGVTARADWFYAELHEVGEGYELVYTSWEYMPAFMPDELPIECE